MFKTVRFDSLSAWTFSPTSAVALPPPVGSLIATESTGEESSERDTENDEITRARRLLTLLKLVLVIIATALTIARMLGWL